MLSTVAGGDVVISRALDLLSPPLSLPYVTTASSTGPCTATYTVHQYSAVQKYKMADLEAVLADVSYLMAMEKSKSTPAARSSKKIILPDPRYDLT